MGVSAPTGHYSDLPLEPNIVINSTFMVNAASTSSNGTSLKITFCQRQNMYCGKDKCKQVEYILCLIHL